jgi:hypothetical protein
MTEQSAEPIASNLARAFGIAVSAFKSWSSEQDVDPLSPRREPRSIVQVCGLVDQFSDRLPAHVFLKLRSYMYDVPHGELISALETDRSYATGARCLRRMVEMKTYDHLWRE